MSRAGYDEDGDDSWATIRWRGMVASAIRGRRGQAFLGEMLEALDALPAKRLIADDLVRTEEPPCDLVRWIFAATEDWHHWSERSHSIAWPHDGCGVCAIGALGVKRGIDMSAIDPEDADTVGATFDIAQALAREVVYENDEGVWGETPEQRWTRMRAWVASHIKTGSENRDSSSPV